MQNLERLQSSTPVGLVQGGLGDLAAEPAGDPAGVPGIAGDSSSAPAASRHALQSLGVVAYEPVWIFAASPAAAAALANGLQALKGKKTAIGADGSGTRQVALQLLQSYGIGPNQATLAPLGGMAAAQALLAGEVDAAILIGAPQTAAVQLLLAQPVPTLVSINHAEGLTRRLPFLSLVTLKAGSFNAARDQPARDITLLATTANLVVRNDLHPALAYLLLEAASSIHKGATLLSQPGEFPNPRGTDFPLGSEAQRYFKDGRPFLQRYLPY